MNECPSCGASLHYDIPSGQLVCTRCASAYDPVSYDRTHAQESGTGHFEANKLTCPNCGAEILAADNSAAEYCSYCGSFVMLSSEACSEETPDGIIPFKIDKEKCKKIYADRLRHHIFAPKELRDPEYLNRFCGFYIPYWVFDIGFAENPRISGTKSHREGDYIIEENFSVTGDLSAGLDGVVYDASSSFDDNISASVAPFKTSSMVPFTPSYLFGFYADTADVDKRLYTDDAVELAETTAKEKILSQYVDHDLHVTFSYVDAHLKRSRRALLPVWFLTWRKDDRVAYSVVNGETGKIYSEIPLDTRRFLLGSLLLAIPLFVLLNLLLTVTATTTMLLSDFLALIGFLFYEAQIQTTVDRIENVGNRGAAGQQVKRRGMSGLLKAMRSASLRTLTAIAVTLLLILLAYACENDYLGLFYPVPVILAAGLIVWQAIQTKVIAGREVSPVLLPAAGSFIAAAAVVIVAVMNPPYDYWYYGGAMVAFAGTAATLLAAILHYNTGVTRQVPNFFTKGKEERI